MASANFRAMKASSLKNLPVGGVMCTAQHNPCRISSTTSEVDAKSISARPCFLCVPNRPAEQFHLKFEGRKGRRYNIQVNPYPIFPDHLVIARDVHTPQTIWHNFVDMMDFARKYPDFLVFYNGPESGASAPDHMHFQAVHVGALPLQRAVDDYLDVNPTPLTSGQDADLFHFAGFSRGVYALRSKTPKSLAKLFYRLVDCAPTREGEDEPRLNMFAYCKNGEYRCIAVLRSERRSHHYGAADPAERLVMSPGAADMGGMLVCPRKEDFEKLTGAMLDEMMSEVSISAEDEKMVDWRLTRKQTKIEVPVMFGDDFSFEIISDGAGPQRIHVEDGKIVYGGVSYDELYFDSVTRSTVFAPASFILKSSETLFFAGTLKFDVYNGTIRAINRIGVENYILSALSEKAEKDTSLEDLKAEAVRMRTGLLETKTGCPPYKGLTIEINNMVRQAVDQTWGQTNTPLS